jgi:hypothetical protein
MTTLLILLHVEGKTLSILNQQTLMGLVTNWKRLSLLFTTLLLITSVTHAATTFTVDPSSLSFNANTGATTSQNLTITNSTAYPLVLTTSLSGTGSGSFSLPAAGSVTVPASGTATLAVTYAPTVAGNTSATVTLRSFTGDSAVIPITGSTTTGGGSGSLTISPSGTLNLNGTVGSTTSTPVTITNTTGLPLTATLVLTGSPSLSLSSPYLSLGANGTSTDTIKFTPNAAGTVTGKLLAISANGDTATANISATATATGGGSLHVNAPNQVYFNATVGQSQCLPVTIVNPSASGVAMTNVRIVGDTNAFSTSGSGSGSTTINGGGSNTLTVCFHPVNANGTVSAELLFKAMDLLDSTLSGTTTIHLSGQARDTVGTGGGTQLPFFLVTRGLDFNNVAVGTTVCQPVAITNPQASAVTIDSASVSGANAAQFVASGGSNLMIAGNTTQYINVCFTANATGNQTGTLTLNYTAPGVGSGTINVPLTANTIDSTSGELTNCLHIRHSGGVIGPIVRGGSTNGTLYLTNSSNGAVTVNSATISGNDAGAFNVATTQFPMTLQAGQQGQLNVAFNPATTSGNSSYSGNVTLSLSGSGITCDAVNIPIHGVAIPGHQNDTTNINLGTGLTGNGTSVIGITNNTGAACVTDTLVFTNTTGAAMTINNLLIPTNPNITVLGSSMNFPATVQADGTVQTYVQFCANGQTNTTFNQPLFVATSNSLTPLQFDVQAIAVAAASVHVIDFPTIEFTVAPNPASNEVTVNIENVRSAKVQVYDVLGNSISEFSGSTKLHWDCRDANGIQLPSGTYTLRLTATDDQGKEYRASKQLVLQK